VGEAMAPREALALREMGRSPLLDRPDPLLRVQPEVAVDDHAGGLLERRLGLLDQETRSFGRSADLRAARVQSQRGDL
jgi:hypothetical protein